VIFDIESFVSAGPIRFGMTQLDVRRLNLGTIRSFRRTPSQLVPSDQFLELGVVVSYKPPGIVETIEFSPPSRPVYCGIDLFGLTVDSLNALLAAKDKSLDVDSDGFIAHATGIGAYVLGADEEEDSPAELVSIIAFEKGYYD
jgi:hypothetical protein